MSSYNGFDIDNAEAGNRNAQIFTLERLSWARRHDIRCAVISNNVVFAATSLCSVLRWNIESNKEEEEIEVPFIPAFELEKERLKKEGWEENDMENGQLSKCYNFKPKYSKIDNKLEVNVGGGTDVVIKLINKETKIIVFGKLQIP